MLPIQADIRIHAPQLFFTSHHSAIQDTSSIMKIPQLPNEITSMIVSSLAGPQVQPLGKAYECYAQGLSSYASVSKEWQVLVERYTFHGLYLTRGRLEDAKRIVNHYRSRQIQTLYFEVTLGEYEVVGLQTEPQSEQLGNSVAYTLDLHSLFRYLSTWDSNDVFVGGLNLVLSAKSRNDIHPIQNILLLQSTYGLLENTRPVMPLPRLEFVQTLMWDFQNCDQDCILDIAWLYALPQLTTLKWELSMRGGE